MDLQVLRICRSQRLDMGLKRVGWVPRYQGQCLALRPLGHQGYRLRSYKKDQPLCSGYTRTQRTTAACRLPSPQTQKLLLLALCPSIPLDQATAAHSWP